MAKLIVLLTLICLQVSRLNASPVAGEREIILQPTQNVEVSVKPDDEQTEEWTEQDKSWLQQVIQLLNANDEEWTEKEDKQLEDIVQKWFTEIGNWFEDDDDDDDDDDWWEDSEEWWDDSEDWSSDEADYFNYSGLSGEEEESINVTVNGSIELNMEVPTVGVSNKFKRFSSI